MKPHVVHERSAETPEAKARWFQSLSLTERMELLCMYTDLALTLNPSLAKLKAHYAQSTQGRVRILSEA